jgi:hypothetical protein
MQIKKSKYLEGDTMVDKKNIIKKRRKLALPKGLIVFGMVAIIGSLIILPHISRKTYTVTIVDKQVKRNDDSDKYLIYSQLNNGETRVFEDTDTLLEGKFNSSDIYGELKINKEYEVQVYGWRIPFLSSYENIIKVKDIK